MTDSNNIIIRDEVKGIIKVFDTETRAAIDKALALGNDFVRAHADEASKVAKARAVAIFHIAKDKEAVEKTGYDSFKELSAALFSMESSTATNYRKAAERFYCNADAPKKLGEWYGPSALYELVRSKASNEELAAAIERGELKEGMTSRELRAWAESRKALTEGEKSEVAKLYDVRISGGSFDDVWKYGLTLDEAKEELLTAVQAELGIADVPSEDDRYGVFNPHAVITDDKGKEYKGKGIFFTYGGAFAVATYFPAQRSKAVTKAVSLTPEQKVLLASLTSEQRALFDALLK